jgi:hypothetical protein
MKTALTSTLSVSKNVKADKDLLFSAKYDLFEPKKGSRVTASPASLLIIQTTLKNGSRPQVVLTLPYSYTMLTHC